MSLNYPITISCDVTLGQSAFQSLAKIIIASGKRELIHQRVEAHDLVADEIVEVERGS